MKKQVLNMVLLGGGVALLLTCLLTGTARSATLKHTPGMTVGSLAGRADTDVIQFSNGRHVTVGQMRRLEAAAKIMRAPRADKLPASLKAKPTGSNIVVSNGRELATALKRPDNDTMQFPSGQRVTVGVVRFLQPYIEKKLGRKMDQVPTRPDLTGPAVNVSKNTTKEEWKNILRKPDSTVLQSPNGARVTIGELKPYLLKRTQARPAGTPVKTSAPLPVRKGGGK